MNLLCQSELALPQWVRESLSSTPIRAHFRLGQKKIPSSVPTTKAEVYDSALFSQSYGSAVYVWEQRFVDFLGLCEKVFSGCMQIS
jgi:hypothetical protein